MWSKGKRSRNKASVGECSVAVKWGENALACDTCDRWFHANCIQMSSGMYETYEAATDLVWECCTCGLKNVSTSVFDSLLDSSTDSNLSPQRNNPKRTPSELKIMCINFQSVWGKKEQIEQALSENNVDIVIGSETHLDKSIKDAEFLPPTYKCYRKDRDDTKGGVIIIAKKNLITEEVIKSNKCELIAIKVQTHKKPVIIAACYRPPKSKIDVTTNICEEIISLNSSFKNCPIWIGGDTNLPDIDWTNNAIVGHQYAKPINESFLETFDQCCLEQIVMFPTRLENTLDIVTTNRPTFVNNCIPHPGLSDHDTAVMLDIVCHPKRSKPNKRKVYLWKRADINAIKDHVNAEIANFIANNNVNTPIDQLWSSFKELTDSSMAFVPSKTTSPRYSQPWITTKCKRLSRRKKRAFNRAKRTNRPEDWYKFKVLTTKSRKTCRAAYNNYVAKCVNPGVNSNPKKLFSFIKSRKCENDGVAPLRDKGQIHINDKEKADILNRQFSSVFSKPDSCTPPLIGERCTPMLDIVVNIAGVKKLLKELNPNKASGPDGIPSKFLKELGNEIAPGLTLIMQASINQSATPKRLASCPDCPSIQSRKN